MEYYVRTITKGENRRFFTMICNGFEFKTAVLRKMLYEPLGVVKSYLIEYKFIEKVVDIFLLIF